MQKQEKLNSRQWDLYNFLKENYAQGIYISKKEICKSLPQHYVFSEGKTNRYCELVERDIRTLNSSNVIQKIIVSNRVGYKIGNEEEVKKYLKKRFNRDWESIKLSRALVKKAKLDDQMKEVFDTQERNFIEAFIEERGI